MTSWLLIDYLELQTGQKFTNSISILKIRQKEKPLHSKGFSSYELLTCRDDVQQCGHSYQSVHGGSRA